MPEGLIGVEVTGLKELQRAIDKLGELAIPEGAQAVAEYMLNVEKAYTPYQAITRKSVYGQSFQSDKQRRWFFAALASGEINVPYQRTQALRNAWQILGKGTYNVLLVNTAQHAQYVKEEGSQNRLLQRMGWKTIMQDIEEHSSKIYKTAVGAMTKTLKKVGLI